LTFSESIKNIKSATEALDALAQMYKNISSSSFNLESLADDNFVSTFSQYTDEFQNFVDTVTNSPSSINACQSAFNDLASAWVNGSGILDDLTEENKDYAIALLEAKGIANAAKIVEYQLTESKVSDYLATHDLADALESDLCSSLGLTSEEALLAQYYLWQLQAAEIAANNASMSFDAQINALANLAAQAGVTAAYLQTVGNMDSWYRDIDRSVKEGGMTRAAAEAQVSGYFSSKLQENIFAYYKGH